jgi:hypothetical protein
MVLSRKQLRDITCVPRAERNGQVFSYTPKPVKALITRQRTTGDSLLTIRVIMHLALSPSRSVTSRTQVSYQARLSVLYKQESPAEKAPSQTELPFRTSSLSRPNRRSYFRIRTRSPTTLNSGRSSTKLHLPYCPKVRVNHFPD